MNFNLKISTLLENFGYYFLSLQIIGKLIDEVINYKNIWSYGVLYEVYNSRDYVVVQCLGLDLTYQRVYIFFSMEEIAFTPRKSLKIKNVEEKKTQ